MSYSLTSSWIFLIVDINIVIFIGYNIYVIKKVKKSSTLYVASVIIKLEQIIERRYRYVKAY